MKLYKKDEVFFKVECNISQALELKSELTCFAPNYKFNPKYKSRAWNGKISFFDLETRLMPIGLLTNFLKFCKKYDYEYEFMFDKSTLINDIEYDDVEKFTTVVREKYNCKYNFEGEYGYQLESIHKAIQCKRGVLLLPTGSGKSHVIYNIIQFLRATNKKVLLVVPNTSLVEQMYNDFIEYGWLDVFTYATKVYSGKKPDYTKQVVITTWQSIHKKQAKFFEPFEAIIVDETHGAKSVSIQSIAKKAVNCEYRLGLTGTLPEVEADQYNIHGYIGPIIYKKKSAELIDDGVLSGIKIANLLVKYPDEVVLKNKRRPYVEEIDTIYSHPKRSNVFNHVLDHIPEGQNSLILCHVIEHLESIERHLRETLDEKYSIYVIHGKIKTERREEIRQAIDKKENVVLIGTYATMSTGINIKRIHNVIFGSSYKAKIKILQSIGRGLRLHKTKDKMILWDIIDDLRCPNRTGTVYENHVFKHWRERLRYYKEQGFEYITGSYKV